MGWVFQIDSGIIYFEPIWMAKYPISSLSNVLPEEKLALDSTNYDDSNIRLEMLVTMRLVLVSTNKQL